MAAYVPPLPPQNFIATKTVVKANWLNAIDNLLQGNIPATGIFNATFVSGQIQVTGPGGILTSYGDFGYSLASPGPIGTGPFLRVAGAGKVFGQIGTDAQIAGQNGINLSLSAGDCAAGQPINITGGNLLLIGGGGGLGQGGTATLQGGTSALGDGGNTFAQGGNSTSGGKAGNLYLSGGLTGPLGGGSVHLIMTDTAGGNNVGSIVFRVNSTVLWTINSSGALFFGATGAGVVGQTLVSQGPNATPIWGPGTAYPITPAESASGALVRNVTYPAGVVDRYMASDAVDANLAFASALLQQQAGGSAIQLLANTYVVTTNAIQTQNNQKPVVIFGVPFRSCIVNMAPANTPTIQLIDQFTFEISGIVFAGRAGFPNTAIDLNSAQGGQRCGFGQIRDCVLMPNGIGIHYAGGNDLVIDSCKYWPNGAGGLPGAATHDGANALPGGIVSDTKGIAGWNPGEVNAVYIRDFQAGQCNGVAATPPGAGILVDGSLNGSSTAPLAGHASTDWVIDGYDSGGCERALYLRFCQFFTVRNLYTSLITLDNDCTGILFESIFGNQIVVDSTKPLGGCDRLTYINCIGLISADSGNSLATHINCDWFGGDGDLSNGKRIVGGRVAGGARVADSIGASGLCLGPVGAIQLAGSSGAGGTISAQGSAVIRLNPAGNCTGIIFNKPPLDGFTSKVINISAFTVTMATAGTSFVADGVGCVIPALREMDFTYDATSGLWFHT